MASIRPLPEAVRSSVRSGISIFDLTRIVEELVYNSLDARATKVSVFVNIGSCYLKVVDDGGGITRDGLELVGERYATSKFLNLADLNATSGNFGFRGEALASISEVSLLEIVTRACGRPNGYRKVLKGCKCLYLGIDDDRKEVGTTVVVCELFYNQPVRRKYLQTSPNKVLQSIKKCIMRLALVRPNISFKVVDIEREDELFCTHSASSPLSLVTSGFGLEVTSSLHELEVENDIIKLSGYISGPCNTSNMKALQYLYINSQFVCKGPIHKILSQLAIRFEHLNSWNTDNQCQNKKRSRSEPCPAYILNLRCPRSLYVLSFEPSKTYVEFKDWAPILDFIEKAIKQFWEGSIACGDSSSQAAYMVQEDQWEKADADVNIISAEAGKISNFGDQEISFTPNISKFGNQIRKDCLDLCFSTSDKLTEDDYHQCNREDVRTSLGYLRQGTGMFNEQQSKGDLLCQTGYSGNLLDVSHAKCVSNMMRKNNSFLMYDNKDLLQGDYFLDGKCPVADSFFDNVPFYATSSSHGRKLTKVDVSVIRESFDSDFLYDCHGFGYDVEIGGDFQKPFLKSCSTQNRSILDEKALLVNDERELQNDSFWSERNLGEDCCSGKDLYANNMMGKNNSFLMYDNKDLLQGDYFLDGKCPVADSFFDNVPFYATSSSHGRKLTKVDVSVIRESFDSDFLYDCHGFGYDVEIGGDFQKPFLKSCSTQNRSILDEKALLVNDERELQNDSFWSERNLGEDCCSGKDLYARPCVEVAKKLKKSKDSDFFLRTWSEENCLPPDSCFSAARIGNSGSDDQLSNSEWHPVYKESSSQATALGVYHTNDINDLRGVSGHYKRIHCTQIFDDEENGCSISYDMSRNANQHHCTSSFANSGFNFDGAVDCNEIFNRLVDWPDFSDVYFIKKSDILNEEPDWMLPESCVRNCKRPNINIGKRDHFRHPTLEKTHERSKRSFSAPPFYRCKRRVFSLNQPPETIAKRPTGQASHPASNPLEASDFKYSQHSPGALYTSNEDPLPEFKTNVKQSSEDLGDTQANDITEIYGFESFNVQHNDPFRELISREGQDSIDYGTKWRNCSPQIPKNDKLVDIQSQNNILDISSGFLHLAGDSLIPKTINKQCLEDAKVLHQVDKKFIPIVAGRTLAVIDQHAADERIRLEELRQKVLFGEAKAITYLDAEQELVLPEIGYQLLHSYKEQIKDWGWICNIHDQNSESFRRNLDILNRQQMAVTLIAVPCILGVNLNDVDLLEFLQQLADTDGSSTMPPSVLRVLNLKACRGAIMFGDSLLPTECSLIVEELKHTSLCFQCAHGRPTTVPLVNLEALHNQIAKLGLMNECSSNKWHGLQRRKICMERAAQRLCSARGS